MFLKCSEPFILNKFYLSVAGKEAIEGLKLSYFYNCICLIFFERKKNETCAILA